MEESSESDNEKWQQVRGVWVSNYGRCWGMKSGKPFCPTVSGGYPKIRNKWYVHCLVAEAFLGPRPSPEHTIDHINRVKTDNRELNLRWATKSEQTSNRVLKKNKAGSRPIEIWTAPCGWTRYPSVMEACRVTGINQSVLSELLHGRETRSRQLTMDCIRYVEVDNVRKGEQWSTVDGIEISNIGRIKCRRDVPFTPVNGNHAGYMRTRGRMVHELVVLAFVGPRPSPQHTVDHINRVPGDNRAENLRWATKKEQSKNRTDVAIRRTTVNVESIDAEGNRVRYASIVEASKATGLGIQSIAFHINPKRIAAKKTKRKWPLKPGKYRWVRV